MQVFDTEAGTLCRIGKKVFDAADLCDDLTTQRSTVFSAGGMNVFQGDGVASIFRTDGTAQEPVAMKHADLPNVARIVADCDIAGQRRIEIARALKMDAVPVDDTRPRHHYQQEVEIFQTFGHSRQPSIPKT